MERYKDGNLEDLGVILGEVIAELKGMKEAIDEHIEENGNAKGTSWSDIGFPVEDIEQCAEKLKASTGISKEETYVDASNYKEVIEEMNRRRDDK